MTCSVLNCCVLYLGSGKHRSPAYFLRRVSDCRHCDGLETQRTPIWCNLEVSMLPGLPRPKNSVYRMCFFGSRLFVCVRRHTVVLKCSTLLVKKTPKKCVHISNWPTANGHIMMNWPPDFS